MWEKCFDRGQKKLRKEIAKKREMKYKVKADLREEKCAIYMAQKEMEKKNEAINNKKIKIANMKASPQEDLLLRLDKKYRIAKSKLRLNLLMEQLYKLERDVKKKGHRVTMLSRQAHRLAFSIPLVREAGPLEEDEKWSIMQENPIPSAFFNVSTSDDNASGRSSPKSIPMILSSHTSVSSSLFCNTLSSTSESNQTDSSFDRGFSHDLGDMQVINLD